jgi:hypothetical protein
MLMFIFLAVPINGGNFAEFYTIIPFWEVLKLGVALPGRVDIWGVTVGIRARFQVSGVA